MAIHAMKRLPSLSIKQVRIINAVAVEASLARAGAHLNSSQSSLSRAIAEAERTLRHRLFERGWRGMEPTSQGEVVIAHCRRMIASIDAAQERLKSQGSRGADLTHHLTWDILQAVSAVRSSGGVSAAAELLGKSQPDVSRALAKLSAALGRQPFDRVRTGMRPLPDADILSDLHSKLLLDIMALPEQLAALSNEVTGRIAVGLLPFSEQDLVVKAFGQILEKHRHVRLQAVTGSYDALIEGLRQGQLDFVIGPMRKTLPVETLTETYLYDEYFRLVVRSGHRLAGKRVSLRELSSENWVVAPHGTPTRHYFEAILLSVGITPPAQTCEIVTFFLAEQMIMHSDAIGLLTYSPRTLRGLTKRLSVLRVDLPDNTRPIGLTHRQSQPFSVAQRTFLDLLNAQLAS